MKDVVSSFLHCVKSRIVVIFVFTWPALISYLVASRSAPPASLVDILKLMYTVSFVGFSVYFYNDLVDIQDDFKNKELGNPAQASRPFGSGLIQESLLKKFVVFSAATGLLVAYSINLRVLGLQLAYMILGFLYSAEPIRLKKRYLMKQPTIAMGCVLVNLVGALTAGVINTPILYMLAIHVVIAVGLNPILDVRDVRGDRIMGVKTVAVVWGPEMTVRLYFASIIAIGAATLLGYSRMGFNIAMPVLVSLIMGAWFYVSLPLLKGWDNPQFLNSLAYKKTFPLYIILQVVPLIGVLNF